MVRLGKILAVLLALAILPFLVAPLLNNHKLNELEQRFLALKHPLQSDHVFRFSKVGLLHYGNGNQCSYIVGEVRSAPGDLGPILAAYEGQGIAGVGADNFRGSTACPVRVHALDAGIIENGGDTFGFYDDAVFKELSAMAQKRRDLYLVVCADTGYPAGFDRRCH